jgi:excisionase family DNA binding protein
VPTITKDVANEVLTLEEAAAYLRLTPEQVEQSVANLGLPGRKIGDQWRFLRDGLRDWLKAPSGKEILLRQAGAFKDDPFLPEIMKSIERGRGRAKRKRA